jgi:hypothetical protein
LRILFEVLTNSNVVNSPLYARRLLYPAVVAWLFISALLLCVISIGPSSAIAQMQEIPTLPKQEAKSQSSSGSDNRSPTTTNTSNIPPPAVEITSLEDGQDLPVGELTIEGTSSDDEENNCQVYADINDITPMQNATAAGNIAEENDFSKWTFTYTQDYQLIKEGTNELTVKISCFDNSNPTPISKWHSVNITGVSTGTSTTTKGAAEPTLPPATYDTSILPEEGMISDTNEEEASENETVEDLSPGVPPTGQP